MAETPVGRSGEGARGLEVRDDLLVSLEDFLSLVLLDRREAPRRIDGGEDGESLTLAGSEIVLAVSRGRVDEPRARVHRDVVGRDDAEGAGFVLRRELAAHGRRQGMLVRQADEVGAFDSARQDFVLVGPLGDDL